MLDRDIILESIILWNKLSETGFEKLPKGWTHKSVQKAGKTIAKDVGLSSPKDKGFFEKCVKKIGKKLKDPEGYCASIKDEAFGKDKASGYWRGKGKTKKEAKKRIKQMRFENKTADIINEYLSFIQEKTLFWKTKIENPDKKELIILCHGWRSGASKLGFLSNGLQNFNYSVYRLNLSTTFGRISKILSEAKQQLEQIDYGSEYDTVHFVAHSFGGIITKTILNNNKINNIGKFVTLGTPWGSTPTAKAIEKKFMFGDDPGLFGNGIKLLYIALGSKFKNSKLPVGLIAGNKPYDEKKDVGEPYDGTVPVKSAFALKENVKGKKLFNLNHAQLANDTNVVRSVIKFLKTGSF